MIHSRFIFISSYRKVILPGMYPCGLKPALQKNNIILQVRDRVCVFFVTCHATHVTCIICLLA